MMTQSSVTISDVSGSVSPGAGGVSAPGGVNGFQSSNGVGGELAPSGNSISEMDPNDPGQKALMDKWAAEDAAKAKDAKEPEEKKKKKRCATCHGKDEAKKNGPAKPSPVAGMGDGAKPAPGQIAGVDGNVFAAADGHVGSDMVGDFIFDTVAVATVGLVFSGLGLVSAGLLGAGALAVRGIGRMFAGGAERAAASLAERGAVAAERGVAGAAARSAASLAEGLPAGSQIIKSGENYVIYRTAAGEERIRFNAAAAETYGEASAGRNYTLGNEAGVTADGKPFVFEGRHRAVGAAHGDTIPSELGGVPGKPGVLDYEYAPGVANAGGLPTKNIKDLTIDYTRPDFIDP